MIKVIKTSTDLIGDKLYPLMLGKRRQKSIKLDLHFNECPKHDKLYMLRSTKSRQTKYGIFISTQRKAARGGFPTYLTKECLSRYDAKIQSIRNSYDHKVNVITQVQFLPVDK